MSTIYRAYDMERDEHGLPCRLVWRGDFRRLCDLFMACPRCQSTRMRANRCLSCWHDAGQDETLIPHEVDV